MIHLPRECHAGLQGPDVVAYSRIYRHLHDRRRDPTRNFGVHMVEATLRFQHEHHLHADGVVGSRTFDAMRPYFDAYDRWLLQREVKKLEVTPQRLIVGAALALYAARPFRYIEGRPIPGTLHEIEAEGSDCSGTSIGCYHYTHLRFPHVLNPGGFGADFRYGSTYTMIYHGERVYTPQLGDLMFYYPTFSHVGVYLGGGRVFSHGAPGDPRIIPASWATQIRRYV